MDKEEFTQSVAAAYRHLYDPVALRTLPLTDILVPDPEMRRKKKSWLVHEILLNIIDEMALGQPAPVLSREWRLHRLLVLRYCDGLSPKVVASELAISLRHFYREHDAAMEGIASILWDRYIGHSNGGARSTSSLPSPAIKQNGPSQRSASGSSGNSSQDVEPKPPKHTNRLKLLRHEVANLQQDNQFVPLAEVVSEVVELVDVMAKQKGVAVSVQLDPAPTPINMDREILRQTLVGTLALLLEIVREGSLHIGEEQNSERALLRLSGRRDRRDQDIELQQHDRAQLTVLSELAAMQGAQLHVIAHTAATYTLQLDLPIIAPRTILLVDDNVDTLDLFQRYLQHRHYHAVCTQSSVEALHMARHIKPYAIVLDLMLPKSDGWDTLQKLVNHADTSHIPVVICTILVARSLAMSLGAAAFLEKPVDEDQLITTLDALVIA